MSNWKSVYPLKEEKQQQAPKVIKSNKFHNFIRNDDYSDNDLEEIARRRFENKIKKLQEGSNG